MKLAADSWASMVLVLLAHIGAIGLIVFSPASKPKPLELPVIQGIFIPAPVAESEQPPTAKAPPPKPVEKKPEPKPVPKPPKPKPVEPKTKPLPKPPVELPPSDTAIEQKAEEVAEAAQEETVAEVPHTPVISDEDRLGSTITPPRSDAVHLNNPQPTYPRVSRQMREQGTVWLEVLIRPDGTVGDARLKKSSGYKRLDETALNAVKHWRYVPAKRGGQAIEYWYEQPIEFKLTN